MSGLVFTEENTGLPAARAAQMNAKLKKAMEDPILKVCFAENEACMFEAIARENGVFTVALAWDVLDAKYDTVGLKKDGFEPNLRDEESVLDQADTFIWMWEIVGKYADKSNDN
jgi:hypothetical protein